MVKEQVDAKVPKKPLSAFFMWMKNGRCTSVMKELNLGRSGYKKAIKICGERWRKLPEEVKMPLQEKYKSLFAKYMSEMAIYKQTKSYTANIKIRKEKRLKKRIRNLRKPKDPNAPKHPLSIFMEFRKRYWLKNPGTTMIENSRAAAKAWKALENNEKKKLVEEWSEKKKIYDQLLEEYKKSEEYAAFQEKIEEYNKKKKDTIQKFLRKRRINHINIRQKRPLSKSRRGSLKRRRKRKKNKVPVSVASPESEKKFIIRIKKEAVVAVASLDEEMTESDYSMPF